MLFGVQNSLRAFSVNVNEGSREEYHRRASRVIDDAQIRALLTPYPYSIGRSPSIRQDGWLEAEITAFFYVGGDEMEQGVIGLSLPEHIMVFVQGVEFRPIRI